ncbi:gliding motility-associated-like protein [Parabacteroides sp. PF5-5]|nr:gliding motility-associated-like protein [Parabacteroides sp. PH5-13]MDH6326570.1 gliding motility-associated-like protein [Parabacteroides sp. PH5-41]MDH6334460.1 gliding motility-associated-like protein [Parabacteroides sp. PF5-5]MDH6345435.1 gliding motility-associated-like protein [Parabacteroides sp. PH5-46]MDH6376148.1 gliding motility-associated-like protein [Parabacteroides sp. PH5-33]MDH6383880.1 gliding motility-associated-like protein [Parabacteroides sp. PH5-17]MDH6393628.1 gli
MQKRVLKRMINVCVLLLFVWLAHAQYTVTGGSGTPLLAQDDTSNHLKVYLVYGMNNLEIRYTSASSSHQWYRYKNRALDKEPVPSTQEGTTSFIRDIEEGYGYFVQEKEAVGSNNFVWIIDYSRYAFDVQNLQIVPDDDPCFEIRLQGTATMPKLTYRIPGGTELELERTFEIIYNTLKWDEENKSFRTETITQSVKKTPFYRSLEPPLCDTDIQLKGDLFSRHFNVEKTIYTDPYQAQAIEVHLDSMVYSVDGQNRVSGSDEGLSAPVEIQFNIHANTPTASRYRLMIYNQESPTNVLIDMNSDLVTYTFREAGKYTVYCEVNNQLGGCIKTDSLTIDVGDSFLEIPNVFSPGTSPGVNDEFRVAYKSIVSFKAWIFNRWGVELFYWTDPNKGWDGKKGGKYVAPGVYFYVIEAKGSDGKSYKRKGSINILRAKNVQDQIIE